ncbi:MAG: hypothetical protein ACXQTY_05700 [Candidatus Methanogasteraceae archaeon]
MIKKILVAILLITLLPLALLPHAAGFAEYTGQDVTIPAYLIELRCNASDDAAVVTETIVFRNNGDTNHTDDLRIIISEEAQIMQVRKMGMAYGDNATVTPIEYEHNGEILRWNATIEPGAMPTMYAITYAVPVNASGFVKKFFYPAVVTYPIGQLRLRIDTDSQVKLTDKLGSALQPDETDPDDAGGVLYAWSGPVAFKELHIALSHPSQSSQSSNLDKWIVYALIALLLISALTYPILHVRNAKLREKDGGAKFSCASCTACEKDGEDEVCDGEGGDEEGKRGGEWDEMDEIVTELTLKKDDLVRKKKAILAVLNKMEEDNDAGAISDADYKRLSSKYEREAIEIMKQLDKM